MPYSGLKLYLLTSPELVLCMHQVILHTVEEEVNIWQEKKLFKFLTFLHIKLFLVRKVNNINILCGTRHSRCEGGFEGAVRETRPFCKCIP